MMELVTKKTIVKADIMSDGILIGDAEYCPETKEITAVHIYRSYAGKGYLEDAVKLLKDMGYHE